jgi:hypothetical protein
VQAAPDSRLAPAAEPPPAGHTRAETELARQVPPADSGVQHEQDALQALAVVEWYRAARARPVNRQQPLDARPQVIVNLPRLHHAYTTSKPKGHRAQSVRSSHN